MNGDNINFDDFEFLYSRAAEADATTIWPDEQLQFLADEEYFRWGLPEAYGGLEKSAVEMAEMYREMASACLLTTFVLTQRNACLPALGKQ